MSVNGWAPRISSRTLDKPVAGIHSSGVSTVTTAVTWVRVGRRVTAGRLGWRSPWGRCRRPSGSPSRSSRRTPMALWSGGRTPPVAHRAPTLALLPAAPGAPGPAAHGGHAGPAAGAPAAAGQRCGRRTAGPIGRRARRGQRRRDAGRRSAGRAGRRRGDRLAGQPLAPTRPGRGRRARRGDRRPGRGRDAGRDNRSRERHRGAGPGRPADPQPPTRRSPAREPADPQSPTRSHRPQPPIPSDRGRCSRIAVVHSGSRKP